MEAFVKHFNYRGRHCICNTGRHQRAGDAGGFPALAQRNHESPPGRCSSRGRVPVCGPVLHHGLQHEPETCWLGDNKSSAYAPGSAYCACHHPRASDSAENLVCTSLQAEPFVVESTGSNAFRGFVRACVYPCALRASSFGEPRKPGVKARDRLGCWRVPAPMRLGAAIEEEAVACFRGVIAYSGDSRAGNPINSPRKCEGPYDASAGADRAANPRYQHAALPGPEGKTFVR